jgi:hypothetical protein
MPEARTWAGPAHDAAAAMFTRATDKASNIAHYADAVAKAFDTGSRTIGSARLALLNTAAEIEDGQLYVTDEWIVMIEPATMSAEAAAALIQRAESEQAEINTLLLDVGDADDKTAAALAAAGANYGLKVPSDQPSLSGLLLPGSSRPAVAAFRPALAQRQLGDRRSSWPGGAPDRTTARRPDHRHRCSSEARCTGSAALYWARPQE